LLVNLQSVPPESFICSQPKVEILDLGLQKHQDWDEERYVDYTLDSNKRDCPVCQGVIKGLPVNRRVAAGTTVVLAVSSCIDEKHLNCSCDYHVSDQADDEKQEADIVVASYTLVYPLTVVVENRDARSTKVAMATPGYFNYLALRTGQCEMNTFHALIPSGVLLGICSF